MTAATTRVYVVEVRAFDKLRVMRVPAESHEQAIERASAECNVSVKVTSVVGEQA